MPPKIKSKPPPFSPAEMHLQFDDHQEIVKFPNRAVKALGERQAREPEEKPRAAYNDIMRADLQYELALLDAMIAKGRAATFVQIDIAHYERRRAAVLAALKRVS